MVIKHDTVAQIAYKIHIDNSKGELIEFADESNPRPMIFGHEKMLPGFESNMLGKSVGDQVEFTLDPGKAFGTYQPDLLIDVPKKAFEVNGELRSDLLYVGNQISMMDHQGNPARGQVMEVKDDIVKMDFNHPLAGKTLYISGKVMGIRPVTEDDLQPKGGCCGGECGCSSENQTEAKQAEPHDHAHAEDENCQVCGNPPELQGQGIGDCRCG